MEKKIDYRTIHYTELPPAQPGEDLCLEWETYRREVGRLLAEGKQGKHVLIKGEEIIGFWDTRGDALKAAYERFGRVPLLNHEVQEHERLYRVSWLYDCEPGA
jgi:hypothetical protein